MPRFPLYSVDFPLPSGMRALLEGKTHRQWAPHRRIRPLRRPGPAGGTTARLDTGEGDGPARQEPMPCGQPEVARADRAVLGGRRDGEVECAA